MLRGRVKNFVKYFIFKSIICSLMMMAGVLVAGQTQAATLYLSPSFGSSSVGKTFAVTVYISSRDEAVNAASGVVSFPNDKLELISLTKTGSIFNLWVAEPSFSQSAGTFSFEGIILNPGYTGTAGKIAWANFKVKAPGTAKLSFSSGAVLANDGEGTNILSGFGDATINLVDSGAKPATPTVEPPKPSSAPPATVAVIPVPKISSDTNPDQNKWYASSRVRLSWPVPSAVTSLRLLLSSSPNDTPTITYVPPINSKELTNLDDGVYYFSARFKDSNGWGDIARYTLRVDTKPPGEFAIGLPDGAMTAKNQPSLQLAALDVLSGLDYWLVKINDEAPITVRPEEIINELYVLPPQNPGVKNIMVEAYDKVGNKISAMAKIEIEGGMKGKNLALTSWPEKIKVGDTLVIRGKTSGINKIIVYWQKDNEPAVASEVVSSLKGNFVSAIDVKEAGNYQAWAEIKDEQGLTIASSDKVNIVVYQGVVAVISDILKQYWWLLIIIVVGTLLITYLKSFLVPAHYQYRQDINRLLYNSLLLLKDGIKDQIKVLMGTKSRRQLNQEETAVMLGLKKTLSNTDRFLAKEITLIKKRKKK